MVVVNVVKGHVGLKYTDSTGIKKIAKCSKVWQIQWKLLQDNDYCYKYSIICIRIIVFQNTLLWLAGRCAFK